MAASRASSPGSESGATSPPQLTPNSKVKAMLAAFDNDSDNESVSLSARGKTGSSLAKSAPTKTTESTSMEQSEQNTTSMATDTSDDEEVVFRPRGRMAAMMQGNDSSEDGEPSAGNARERVKKMLMTKGKSRPPTSNTEEANESSGSDTRVVSRKRKLGIASGDAHKPSPPKRSASPSLFVSPTKSTTSNADNADADCSNSDADLPDINNSRFKALLETKRLERRAKDAAAAKERAKKAEERKKYAAAIEEDDLEDSDADRRLTHSSRPSRKASKKALEEMHRETQRLSRNQQLAHIATTKKKVTKASLFAKFNFRNTKEETPEPTRPASSSSATRHSDMENKETPPTSPASPLVYGEKALLPACFLDLKDAVDIEYEQKLPSLQGAPSIVASSSPTKLETGKGKAIENFGPVPKVSEKPTFTLRPIRTRAPRIADRKVSPLEESDSDLEIVSVRAAGRKQQKMDAIFDRVPAKLARESHSLHALRMLAQVASPGKQDSRRNSSGNKKPSMTTSELQMSLQQRARQQAAREREERLQALKDKGIFIQTSEEREKDLAEVDDMVARARREGEEIAKREKVAARKERKANGETDPQGYNNSDDEDWNEVSEAPEEEVSGSGSEVNDEGEDESVDESGGEDEDEMELSGQNLEASLSNPMFSKEAAETDTDEAGSEVNLSIHEGIAEDGDAEDEDEETLSLPQKARRSRNLNVISDDEDDDEQELATQMPAVPKFDSPLHLSSKSSVAPNSVLRSATKTFIPGLTVAGPAGLGLTQIFAGTMDDSQAFGDSARAADSQSPEVKSNQDKMAFLRCCRAPELPPFVPTLEEDTQDTEMIAQSQLSQIPDSQPVAIESQNDETQIQLHFSQFQIHEFDSIVHDTQMSQFPATQDVGYQHMTPIKGRFVDDPPSTIDTVILEPAALPETTEEAPIVKKKGKLRQRARVATFSDEEDAAEPEEKYEDEDEFEITANAFDVMRKNLPKMEKKVVADDFNKKKSKAKDMVNEQAEESEDEYAGLGGASDEESGGEDDEFVKEMIDDESGKNVDGTKLAAFFADRERISDEKQIEKLYKDITNGILRRKRGADYDLSDSDDGGEARQRRKRKEFAKMRKALLADEKIGKIAENPKRQAFLRAIEDRGSEDEMDFLDDFAEQEEGTDSQSQSQGEGAQTVPDSQPITMGPPKRKHSNDTAECQNRAPPYLRRTKPAKRPSNLSEIRESLSSLIEEPNDMHAPSDSSSDCDDELEIEDDNDLGGPRKVQNKENRDPFALRRTNVPIVDRISLKRASSSSISDSTKLAFAVSSATPGFKVPPLLRRATTNNSIASSTSSSVSGGMLSATERMAGGAGNEGVKRGGGKKSGVNFFAARETERRAAVVKTEKRKEQKMVNGAEKRRKIVGGLFGGGKFE
ncbi:MRC1-like domain-containing protein [Diplocarpon rosae]|nr:MRC1-like domain-containing protein [Diplocarpon rosae]